MTHAEISHTDNEELTTLIANLVSYLEELHPNCWNKIQCRADTFFKRRLNKDFAIAIANLFNPLALFQKHKFPTCRAEDYFLNAQRDAIREFIDQQDISIEDYNFTDKEKIFLGLKTCDVINFPKKKNII